MYLISFNVYNNSEGLYIAITVLQVRKLKPRFRKQFAPGHTPSVVEVGFQARSLTLVGLCLLFNFGYF